MTVTAYGVMHESYSEGIQCVQPIGRWAALAADGHAVLMDALTYCEPMMSPDHDSRPCKMLHAGPRPHRILRFRSP